LPMEPGAYASARRGAETGKTASGIAILWWTIEEYGGPVYRTVAVCMHLAKFGAPIPGLNALLAHHEGDDQ